MVSLCSVAERQISLKYFAGFRKNRSSGCIGWKQRRLWLRDVRSPWSCRDQAKCVAVVQLPGYGPDSSSIEREVAEGGREVQELGGLADGALGRTIHPEIKDRNTTIRRCKFAKAQAVLY